MKHFAAIIFDMDGLLLDTERIGLSAFLETCTHLNLPLLEEVFIRCLGTNESRGRELLEDGLHGEVDHLAFLEMWDRFLKRAMDKPIPLKEGAVELLNHISAIQIPVAVATSTRLEPARNCTRQGSWIDSLR